MMVALQSFLADEWFSGLPNLQHSPSYEAEYQPDPMPLQFLVITTELVLKHQSLNGVGLQPLSGVLMFEIMFSNISMLPLLAA